jgi:uncharacterized protein
MERSVTVSTRGLLVALVVTLALVVAYLLGGDGGTAQASPVSADSHARTGTLAITGTGTTVGIPDELAFTVSAAVVRPTLGEAMAAGNDTMSRVLAALDGLGVRTSDVQTTGLQMTAVYDYHAYSPPTLRGYRVSQQAQVLVRDLARGGRAVTAVVRAGGNDVRVRDLGLRLADPDSLLAKSRAQAVAAATAKAQEYAEATHQTLGAVTSLREVHVSSAPRPQMLRFGRDAMADVATALPIRAGKDKLGVTVRIVWRLS